MVNVGNTQNPTNISSLGCGVFTGVNAQRDFVGLPEGLGQAGVLIIRASISNTDYSTVAICTEDNKGTWGRVRDNAPWIKQ